MSLPIDARSFLIIRVGHMTLGLVVSAVREVVRAVYIAPVPSRHPLLEGVVDVRGTIVPVLDIRKRLGLPESGLRADQYLVLAQTRTRRIALRVDEVQELVTTPPGALVRAESSLEPDAVAGIARTEDGIVVIHDLEAFLTMDQERHLDAVLEAI